MKHLETAGRRYIIAMRLSDYVQSAIRQIGTWALLDTGIEMARATVLLSTWTRERRMIFVRQHVPTRPQATGKQHTLFKELDSVRPPVHEPCAMSDCTQANLQHAKKRFRSWDWLPAQCENACVGMRRRMKP